MSKWKLLPLVVIIIPVIAISFCGCSEKIINESGENLNVSVGAWLGGGKFAESLTQFTLTVTGPEIEEPIIHPLELVGGYVVGQLNVPSGQARQFEITIFDNTGRLIYAGATVADLIQDEIKEINISLYPQMPMIKFSPGFVKAPKNIKFTLDIKVYHLDSLNRIGFNIDPTEYLTLDSLKKHPDLNTNVIIYSPDTPPNTFYILAENPGEILVNDSGYAALATAYFTSQSSDIQIIQVYPEIQLIELITSGEFIPPEDVFFHGSNIVLSSSYRQPVAIWPMDTAGTKVPDISGNNLHGTAHGTSTQTGFAGMARFFNGISDYVEVPGSSLLNINRNMAVFMHVRIDESEQDAVILSKRVPEGNINYMIKYADGGLVDTLAFAYGPHPGHSFAINCNINDGQWHSLYFAIRFGDPNSAIWIVDQLLRYGYWESGDGSIMPAYNIFPLQLGRQLSNNNQFNYFNGGLDEVFIYNIQPQ